jgi:hypothetical protein
MTKHPKTTAPYLIFFSLISAAGMASIKNASLRRAITALIVVFGLLQYFDVSYKEDIFFSHVRRVPLINVFAPVRRMAPPARISFQPQKCPPVSEEILSMVGKESAGNPSPFITLSYRTRQSSNDMNSIIANGKSLEYIVKSKNLPYRLCDVRTNDLGTIPGFVVLMRNIKDTRPKEISDKYALIKTFVLPDKSCVYFYKYL